MAWVELRLQNAEGWFCEVCWCSKAIARVCVCVCVVHWVWGAQKSIKCVETDVIRWATYHFSTTTIRHVVYHREKGRAHPRVVYVGSATACKTLPWRRGIHVLHLLLVLFSISFCYHCCWPASSELNWLVNARETGMSVCDLMTGWLALSLWCWGRLLLKAINHLKSYAHAYQQGLGNNCLSVCFYLPQIGWWDNVNSQDHTTFLVVLISYTNCSVSIPDVLQCTQSLHAWMIYFQRQVITL